MNKKKEQKIAEHDRGDQTLYDLEQEGIISIVQKGQLFYAYRKAIYNGDRPKTLVEEAIIQAVSQKEGTKLTLEKTERTLTLQECINTINTYCKNDNKKIALSLHYKPFELLNLLKKKSLIEYKTLDLFQSLHALSSDEQQQKDPSFLACNNKLKEAFNKYYPDHDATKDRTIGSSISLIELVSLVGEKTSACKIHGMGPKRYCTLEEIFLNQGLQLDIYFKRADEKKKNKEE